MSAQYFILPINPGNWEHNTSSLQIDPQELRNALQKRWSDVQFVINHNFALRWIFHHLGAPGAAYYTLHNDRQFISFYNDIYFREFLIWFRQFIPETHPLYFLTSAHSEDDFLELTLNTTEADIDYYLEHPKTS